MQINKTDFKVILNHMKSLSQLENNELINQTRYGKTDYNDINQLINIYSSKKISKLMDKINNNFLTFGGGTIREQIANAYVKAKEKAKAKAQAKSHAKAQAKAHANSKDKYTEQYIGDDNNNDNGQRQELLDCITKLEKYIINLQKHSK